MSRARSKGPSTVRGITGRDDYIVVQAVTTAYALIGTLPPECQEESNRHDMALLLKAWLGAEWKIAAHKRRHVLTSEEWHNGKVPLARDDFEDIDY